MLDVAGHDKADGDSHVKEIDRLKDNICKESLFQTVVIFFNIEDYEND